MTLGEIISAARGLLRDEVTPYLWSDEELTLYVNEAVERICRETRILVDSETQAVCSISVSGSTHSYSVHNSIIEIKRAKTSSSQYPLINTTIDQLDQYVSKWEARTGPPTHYILNMLNSKIRLWPTPTASDTLNLTVVRLPINKLSHENLDGVPEIVSRYHDYILNSVLERAYQKADDNTFNAQLSVAYKKQFDEDLKKIKRERLFYEYPGNSVNFSGAHM